MLVLFNLLKIHGCAPEASIRNSKAEFKRFKIIVSYWLEMNVTKPKSNLGWHETCQGMKFLPLDLSDVDQIRRDTTEHAFHHEWSYITETYRLSWCS